MRLILLFLLFIPSISQAVIVHPGHYGPSEKATYSTLSAVFMNVKDNNKFDAFYYELDTVPAFNSAYKKAWRDSIGYSYLPMLEMGKTYYMRSKVYLGMDSSDFNNTITFYTSNKLQLLTPRDGSSGPASYLRWREYGIFDVQLQIDEKSSFDSPTLLDTILLDSFSGFKGIPYKFGKTYYWRAKVAGGVWSDVFDFTILDTAILKYPRVGVIQQASSSKLTAVWDNVDQITIQIQSSLSSDFAKLTLDTVVSDNSGHRFDTIFWNFNTDNYVRMRYLLPNDSTNWSNYGRIRLTSPYSYDPTGGTMADSAVLFRFGLGDDNGESYHVQIDTSENFDSPIRIDSFFDTKGYFYSDRLLLNADYHWRVRAIHSFDTSDWSFVRNFVTPSSIYSLVYVDNITKYKIGETGANVSVRVNGSQRFIRDYLYEIDTVSTFNSPALVSIDTSISIGLQVSDLIFGQRYYIRAKFSDGRDTTSWIDYVTFDVGQNIVYDYPPNGAKNWGLNNNLAIRTSTSGANYYIYQYDTTASFNSPILFLGNDTDGQSMPVPTPHLFSTVYYWRAAMVHNKDTSDWGAIWNFESYSIQFLDEPKNNAVDLKRVVKLSWYGDSDLKGYEVQVATDTPFIAASSIQVDKGWNTDTTLTLDYGKKYYWRVRPVQPSETGPWSEVWTFTTEDEPIIPTPKLIRPFNNSTTEDSEQAISFQWTVTGKPQDRYQMQVSRVSDLSSPLYNNEFLMTSTVSLTGFDYETTYYWRVRNVTNASNKSNWSSVYQFTTKKEIIIGISTSTQTETSIYPNPFIDYININLTYKADEILIYNSQGKLMYRSTDAATLSADTYSWPKGFYQIQIRNEDTVSNHKIVKQ